MLLLLLLLITTVVSIMYKYIKINDVFVCILLNKMITKRC